MGRLLTSQRWRDALLALALSLWLVVELAIVSRETPVEPAAYALGLVTTAPLALRWRAPVAVALGVQVAFVAGALVVVQPDSLPQAVAVYVVATYTAAVNARSWQGAVACGLASMLLLGLQGLLDEQYGAVGATLANVMYTALVWTVAAAVRVHADRAARAAALASAAVERSERRAQEAVAAERARLARELHDVVAHALSIVVVRARGGVHEARTEPEAAAVALRDVEQVASRALADMRRLLELVHPNDGTADLHPQPGIADVPDLVRRTSQAGVPTRLAVNGEPRPVSPGLGLTAYRVVQESLTNVARHGRGSGALVALTWRPAVLRLEVADTPDGAARAGAAASGSEASNGPHRGLAGMRERIELFGGTLRAGPTPEGGFRVQADLPVPP